MTKRAKGKVVFRTDMAPISATFFTEEGYLVDHPIVTTCGIFEYAMENGGIRRELRLPEEVFDEESLASYEGKPIIITHDAGEVDKNNVTDEEIGTILTKGYRDHDDVRAKIIIHDTDSMKECKLRELSLGYSLTLDETPGIWKGQEYDAIQRDIRVNHLALVDEARAGKSARLNIDSRDKTNLTGGKPMIRKSKKHRKDGAAPDELQSAVDSFYERRAQRMAAKEDEENNNPFAEDEDELEYADCTVKDENDVEENQDEDDDVVVKDGDDVEENQDEDDAPSSQVQMVKDRRDERDVAGDPQNLDEAMETIAQQDEDIDSLLGVIDALTANKVDEDDVEENQDEDDKVNEDEDEEENSDSSDDLSGSLNKDSVDKLVAQKIELSKIGDQLHIDGIDKMSVVNAKRAVIRKVKPTMRLDGKSKAYIDAAYDIAVQEMRRRKTTNDQRKSMFNKDTRDGYARNGGGAASARQRMIERKENRGGKK